MRHALRAAVVLLALLVAACSTAPRVASTWSDPAAAPKPYGSLVVFGVAAKGVVRRAFEDGFVAALRERGVKARPGYSFLSEGGLGDQRALKRAVSAAGAEGVVFTHLVGAAGEGDPAAAQLSPARDGRLYPYYQGVFDRVTEPGHYAHYTALALEANLYDAARETLRWSGRSVPMDPSEERTTINQVIEAMVAAMAQAGYLPQ
jgi:hypothetical protein